jgi:hypothetical protein
MPHQWSPKLGAGGVPKQGNLLVLALHRLVERSDGANPTLGYLGEGHAHISTHAILSKAPTVQ